MKGRISRPQTAHSPRYRLNSLEACEELLLDAVQSAPPITVTDPLPDAISLEHSTKRRLEAFETDAACGIDGSPAKRARLASSRDNFPPPEDTPVQLDRPALQHPKPRPAHAPFLREFVDASAQTFISLWLESVRSAEPQRCRSDSYIHYSSPIPRRRAASAPETSYTRNADGFLVPRTPASTLSRPSRARDGSLATSDTGSVGPSDNSSVLGPSAGESLVEDAFYRVMNLAANHISLRHPSDTLPGHVASLVDYARQDRDSPGPSADEIRQDRDLYALSMGATEPNVERQFYSRFFPEPTCSDNLGRSDRQPMSKHAVPTTDSKYKVSTPIPDSLYGYNREFAFPQQQGQLLSLGAEPVANNQDLLYPFFVIEFKGDGPGGVGSLWVATNQCLGASASCVNVAERLNHQLRKCNNAAVRPLDSSAFSVAIRGSEARLYVSWKHDDLDYYMQEVECFVLHRPEHYIEFRRYVRNILDWGKDRRLKEIRDSLDMLLEESKKRAAEVKNRPAPSDSSSSGGSDAEKRKPLSSKRSSSTSSAGAELR